jgi:hypothetical protein
VHQATISVAALKVRKGQVYTIVVRQETNATTSGRHPGVRGNPERPSASMESSASFNERRVLGSFQLMIPVRVGHVLLEPEERLLAIMRWIDESIQATDRWLPVFDRYLEQIADRVRGFGGDPTNILPSPIGSIPYPDRHRPKREEFAFRGKVAGLYTTASATSKALSSSQTKDMNTPSGVRSMKSSHSFTVHGWSGSKSRCSSIMMTLAAPHRSFFANCRGRPNTIDIWR